MRGREEEGEGEREKGVEGVEECHYLNNSNNNNLVW